MRWRASRYTGIGRRLLTIETFTWLRSTPSGVITTTTAAAKLYHLIQLGTGKKSTGSVKPRYCFEALLRQQYESGIGADFGYLRAVPLIPARSSKPAVYRYHVAHAWTCATCGPTARREEKLNVTTHRARMRRELHDLHVKSPRLTSDSIGKYRHERPRLPDLFIVP
jgi:hypothetical protein